MILLTMTFPAILVGILVVCIIGTGVLILTKHKRQPPTAVPTPEGGPTNPSSGQTSTTARTPQQPKQRRGVIFTILACMGGLSIVVGIMSFAGRDKYVAPYSGDAAPPLVKGEWIERDYIHTNGHRTWICIKDTTGRLSYSNIDLRVLLRRNGFDEEFLYRNHCLYDPVTGLLAPYTLNTGNRIRWRMGPNATCRFPDLPEGVVQAQGVPMKYYEEKKKAALSRRNPSKGGQKGS